MDSLLGFSNFPIKFIIGLGLLSFLIAIIMLVIILYQKCTGIIDVEGYSSIIILILIAFAIIMLSLGILGEYICRIFDATRVRPPFIIDEKK